jgi:single-strand DNA-binding protein
VLNKVLIIGNLGRDPEVRFTSNGKAVAKFPVATSERWTDQDGNKQERTEWHNVVVWGKQAETCGQYLSKGRQVFVEGSVRTRQYDDKDGNKRYITEIVARDVRFLGSPGGRGGDQMSAPRGEDLGGGGGARREEEPGGGPPDDDDIPF